MPKYATQPHWRMRRQAIDKKGALDVELLQESETIVFSKKQPEMRPLHSPTSIFQVPEQLPPEMKPIMLPGAWMEVGKRGKPIVNKKMYEAPVVAKKKRKRTRKAEEPPESIWALEEAAGPSKCLQALHTATSHHDKMATRGRTAKYWARYTLEKQAKMYARDVLLASDAFAEEGDEAVRNAPEPMKVHDNKKWGARDKARRLARDAKAELRCFWPEDKNDTFELPAADAANKPRPFAPSPKSSAPASPFVVVQPPSPPADGNGNVALPADFCPQKAEASNCTLS